MHRTTNVCARPLRCAIFDIDGTLTRTNELIFASFNHVATKRLGRRFAPEEIVALFGPPEEGAVVKVFGAEAVDEVMEELLAFYASQHSALASLHAGMEEILASLRSRGVRLAIFTGKGRRTTAITLETLNLAGYFDMIVSGNDVVHHKPNPEGIVKVLEAFALEPAETVMVGDSMSDVKAARAAGIRIASVLWDCYDCERVRQANADLVFERPDQLLRWFQDQPTAPAASS
jgi:HAD superfamily hydrolase (TIGR01509 family)